MFGRKKEFLYKKSYLRHRLQHTIIENGVAYIPCKVKGMDDMISRFSIKGVETLDLDFFSYILGYTEYISPEYPVVLRIIGPEFSPEEKRTITEAITSDMDYLLGKTEETSARRKRRFLGMILGTILSGPVLVIAKRRFPDLPLELSYILFWLFADSVLRYLFIEKLDFREEKIRMGRLASMEVQFVTENDPPASE